jgi:hypothetical protein
MNFQEAKRRAWEAWHGRRLGPTITSISPSFNDGFDSARMAIAEELRPVLGLLDDMTRAPVARTNGDQRELIGLRDKLRELTND